MKMTKNAIIGAVPAGTPPPLTRLLRFCVNAGIHRKVRAAKTFIDILLIERELEKLYFIVPSAAKQVCALLAAILCPNNPLLSVPPANTGRTIIPAVVEDLHCLPPAGITPGEKFIFVSGTSFVMGKPGGSPYEPLNQRRVRVDSFYIAEQPVSQGAFYEIMGLNPSYRVDAALPVEGVSWYDAVSFCNKKSLRAELQPVYRIDTRPNPQNPCSYDSRKWTVTCNDEANGFRLPESAEWECAYLFYRQEDQFKTDGHVYEWCQDLWMISPGSNVQFERTFRKTLCSWEISCEYPCGAGVPYIGSMGFRLARSAFTAKAGGTSSGAANRDPV
jgi:hypothetical protein